MELLEDVPQDFNAPSNFMEESEGIVNPKIESDDDPSESSDDDEVSLDHSFNSQSVSYRDCFRRPLAPIPLEDATPDASPTCRANRGRRSKAVYTNGRKRKKVLRSSFTELRPESPASLLFPGGAESQAASQMVVKEEEEAKESAQGVSLKLEPDLTPQDSSQELDRPSAKEAGRGVKRSSPEKPPTELPADADEETKRAKQERNRVCARECRKRKKQYLESVESQVLRH